MKPIANMNGEGSASSEVGQDDKEESPEQSPSSMYKPVSRNPSLKFSGGALHGFHQPTSFDHNFDSLNVVHLGHHTKSKSTSPQRRPMRRQEEENGQIRGQYDDNGPIRSQPDESRHVRGGQLPPLVRVRADLASEGLVSGSAEANDR